MSEQFESRRIIVEKQGAHVYAVEYWVKEDIINVVVEDLLSDEKNNNIYFYPSGEEKFVEKAVEKFVSENK